METPGRRFKPEELERMGIPVNGNMDDTDHPQGGRPEGEVLLDDSSEDSDEDVPEPSDRPTRTRRQNNNYRGENMINSNTTGMNQPVYPQPGLPAIAPANPYSPTAPREPLLTSSFQTPVAASVASPLVYPVGSQSQYPQESRHPGPPAHSSPIHTQSSVHGSAHGPGYYHSVQSPPAYSSYSQPVQPAPASGDTNSMRTSSVTSSQPIRPGSPYQQFCEHMRPQLEADNYPSDLVQSRIDEEWQKLSRENRGLWEDRYNEQMREYQEQMDGWKRMNRAQHGLANSKR